jgi:hypothetical protein
MNLETELFKTAASTFEELAFLFVMPELAEDREKSEFEASATVGFTGPFCGRLTLTLNGSIMPSLALNMLGTDELPPRPEQCDALGEMANVICGNILPRIAGAKEVFTISAPEILDAMVPGRTENLAATAEVRLPLEEGRADISLYMES